MTHEPAWYHDRVTDYVTGALPPDEEEAFLARLATDEALEREVTRAQAELRWLPMAVTPVPDAKFVARVEREVLGKAPTQRISWWMPALAAASMLVAVGASWRAEQRVSAIAARVGAAEQRAADLADSLSVVQHAAKVMTASIEMDGHKGGLIIMDDPTSHRWRVVMHGLPPAPAGTRYQFWFVTSDGMVRGATVQPNDGRSAQVTLGMPARGAVMGAALTMEPMGNTDGPPQGKQLAHLMLDEG